MSSNSPLTHRRQYLTSRSSPDDRLRHRLPVPPPLTPQPLLGSTLFRSLLFNREQVYDYRNAQAPGNDAPVQARDHDQSPGLNLKSQTASRLYKAISAREHLVEDMSPTFYLQSQEPAATVSKRRGRPPRKSSTKSKGQPEEATSRKRPASKVHEEELPAKAPKFTFNANTGRRMGTGRTVVRRAPTPDNVIIIPDDDDENVPKPKPKPRKEPARPQASNNIMTPKTVPAPQVPSQVVDQSLTPFMKVDSPDPSFSADDLLPRFSSDDSISKKEELAQDLQDARQELVAAKETIQYLQQELEKARDDQNRATKAEQDLGKLTGEVEAKERAARIVLQERDQLREQLREQNQEALSARERHLKGLQQVRAQYEKEVQGRKDDENNHSEILDNILKSHLAASDIKVKSLETQNARLLHEVVTLKAAATSFRSLPTLSPAPSSICSDEDKRKENVRKMFVTTKRKYDILQSAASNLVTCMRSMDLSCFGEFGGCVKKLRDALDPGDGSQSSRQALILRKADDDDDDDDDDDQSESQRSRG
jgi:hypothetical protein